MGQARCFGLTSLRTEPVLLQSTAPPHPVGAPAPGANGAGSVFWFDFASHRGGAPTIERVTPPVGAPAPGANGRARCIDLTSLRTEAVLLQSNAQPHHVGAPALGANKRSPGPHQGQRSGKPNELPQACRAPCKCSLRSGRIGAFGWCLSLRR